ncbi:MAG: ATP-binding protein [Planctomycetes bacterium]|nr:ATP-binding protein [Planctomycetota bacterium]
MSDVRDWIESNQRQLVGAIAAVRSRLAGDADAHAGAENAAEPPESAEQVPAFRVLQQLFALSRFELDIVLLCAGAELSDECAATIGEHGGVSFGLALARLEGAHWSALTPSSPLRYWRLVNLVGSGALTRRELRIDERALHFLTGVDHPDEQLDGYVEPVTGRLVVTPSHGRVVQQICSVWRRQESTFPVIQLIGADAGATVAVAFEAAAAQNWRLFRLGAEVLPGAPEAMHSLCRLWNREAMLSNAVLLIDARAIDAGDVEHQRRIDAVLSRVLGPVIVQRDQMRPSADRVHVALTVERAPRVEQAEVWRRSLGADVAHLNGEIDEVTGQFSMDVAAIESAALQLRSLATGPEPEGSALWAACRQQSRERTSGFARRVDLKAGWDDLVLPEAQRALLREIVTHVRYRGTVHESWGFATRTSRGMGVSVLFAGPSGTGKTMAAEVLASELRLDLLHVDLSCVVSKYIGETEKHLARIFEEAEAGGAILLFDEADALFGKRSEVHDSHDRYANLEVSYLLQRMEAYRGLAILTTNLKSALDDAFQRRLRFVVNFPFPGPDMRAEIWRRMIPAEAPVDRLDFARLAQLNAPGGTIRTVALHAAFLAAAAREPVRMTHLLTAAQRVAAKSEVPLTASETRGWV